MKNAYTPATSPSEVHSFPGRWIWKLHTLPKIQMFIWKCMQSSIGVKDVRTYVNYVRNICHLELANPLKKRTLLVIG